MKSTNKQIKTNEKPEFSSDEAQHQKKVDKSGQQGKKFVKHMKLSLIQI